MRGVNNTNTEILSAQTLMIQTTANTLSADEILTNNPFHQGTETYVISGR